MIIIIFAISIIIAIIVESAAGRSRPQEGWNALHLLANNYVHGKAQAIDSLLTARASTEATRGADMTPLIMAAATGHGQAIDVLLRHGANVAHVSSRGTTALDACWHNQALAQSLRRRGAGRGAGVTGEGRRQP